MTDIDLDHFRKLLRDRRREVFETRQEAGGTWQTLNEPEIEPEEEAGKAAAAKVYARLEAGGRHELEAIDAALARIEEGRFGRCDACGRRIDPRRLEAVPWSAFCLECARRQESDIGPEPSGGEPAGTASREAGGRSDGEMGTAVREALARDGRVETGRLDVSVQDGVVRLEGFLPGEPDRHVLRHILQDVLGFRDVEERVRIDRTLFPAGDRAPARRGKSEKDQMMEGEGAETDVTASREDGEPLSPPDRLVPEGE